MTVRILPLKWMRLAILVVIPLPCGVGVLAAAPESSLPDMETILVRMAEARSDNLTRLHPYTVKRRYGMFGRSDADPKSQVIAVITFTPPSTKNFIIEKSSGGRLGQRIVRGILQAETRAAKDFALTDFSAANYNFRFLTEEHQPDGRLEYILELLPKRQEKNLILGKLWVDADTYRVRRVEGKPAKATSWLVRDVELVLHYGDVGGMWLHTGTEATAKVRFLGPHSMISSDLEYDISK